MLLEYGSEEQHNVANQRRGARHERNVHWICLVIFFNFIGDDNEN